MSLVFLMRATRSLVIWIWRRAGSNWFILSWFIYTCTVRSEVVSGPTLSTAGRQKNVMQSKIANYFSSRLSTLSSLFGSGLTDLMKMNSNSVSFVALWAAVNGSLNFWTPWPSLVTIGMTGISRPFGVIALVQTRTGFYNFPQRMI